MTTKTKQRIKAFVIKWEMRFYALSAAFYIFAVPTLAIVFPDVSNLWVTIFILISGLFATIAAAASAIKANDTTE